MINNEKPTYFDSKLMEEWQDTFFLDPYTNYLDETVFRIDLYDSETAFIVEALLPSVQKDNIDISIKRNELHIKIKQIDPNNSSSIIYKNRTVYFPTSIHDLKMEASYFNNILEIKIFKEINVK